MTHTERGDPASSVGGQSPTHARTRGAGAAHPGQRSGACGKLWSVPAVPDPPKRVPKPDGRGFESPFTEDQKRTAVEFHLNGGLSYAAAARAWCQKFAPQTVTAKTVRSWVKAFLEDAAVEGRMPVEAMRQGQRTRLESAYRIAVQIATGTRCTVCQGVKTIPLDRLDPGLGNEVCPKCEGSGLNENESTRIAALNTIKSLMEREAKLFGLDAPILTEQTTRVAIALDVAGIPDEGLGDAISDMFAQTQGLPDFEGTAVELEQGSGDLEGIGAEAD